jgi:hypothetical protein
MSSSLTIATGTESTVSDSEKSRPATCGIPIVLKNPGVIGRTWLDDSWPSAGFGRSTRQKLVPMHANGTGRHEAPAACCTPGSALIRGRFTEKLPAWVRSYRVAGLHARREHALRSEAKVDALQLHEAPHQQTGAGDQHERQRNFGDDEQTKHSVQAASTAVTPAIPQRIARLACRDECRDDAKDDSGRQRDDRRERDDRQVERDLIEPRDGDAIADEREQASMAQRRNGEPRGTAGSRERQTLGEHLAYPAAACAKRRSYRPRAHAQRFAPAAGSRR